jgi:hypothetical protein
VADAHGYPFFIPKEISPDKAIAANQFDVVNNDALYEIGGMRRYAIVNITNTGTSPVESVAIQLNSSNCVYVVEKLDEFSSPKIGNDRIELGTMGQDSLQTVHVWYNIPAERPNSLSVVHKSGKQTIRLDQQRLGASARDYGIVGIVIVACLLMTLLSVQQSVRRVFNEFLAARAARDQQLANELQRPVEE